MTLDEAIAHAKGVAENWKSELVNCVSEEGRNTCLKRAAEHEQLAERLTELQERREAMEYIKKHYVLVEKSPKDKPNELIIRKAFGESEAENE